MEVEFVEYQGRLENVEDVDQVLDRVNEVRRSSDPNIDLVTSAGDRLSVSLRDQLGLVRFSQQSLEPPYLSARRSESERSQGPAPQSAYFEFLIGDTPTPVPVDRCLPLEKVKRIVEFFSQYGELPSWVDWVED